MRAARPVLITGPKTRMHAAPTQYINGPESNSGAPTTFGSNQSVMPPYPAPVAMVHIAPKAEASSLFHGSRPIRPGRMYSRQSAASAQRGSFRVADAVSRAGDGCAARVDEDDELMERDEGTREVSGQQKRQPRLPFSGAPRESVNAMLGATVMRSRQLAALPARLPNFWRNLSMRPAVSMTLCLPV